MKPTKPLVLIVPFIAGLHLATSAAIAQAQPAETGLVKLTDFSIQYFSRGKGELIVLLPGGTLTVGYLDGLAEALAGAGYRVVGINFRDFGRKHWFCRGRHTPNDGR